MNLLRRFFLRLRAIVARPSLEHDMQSEMQEHIDRATDRFVAQGMSLADARLAAKREFGNLTVLEEDARDARGGRWVDALAGDLRFAIRYFTRHKATAAIIIAVLALSTGGNTLIFSITQSQFFRPAPAVPNDRELARIWGQERTTQTGRWQARLLSQRELVTLAGHREVFNEVGAWTSDDVVLDGGDSTGARGVRAQFVTPNFLRTLGVPLAAGQGFSLIGSDANSDDSGDMLAVLSYGIAEQLYGSAAAAVGRRILVNELALSVVGVTPPRFQGALRNMDEPALWIPLSARAKLARSSPQSVIDQPVLSVFGRLAPGSSGDRATALARVVVTGALPDSAARVGMSRTADVIGMNALPPGSDSNDIVIAFTMITLIGVLVLLVAWMNVSSLMVAAAIGRRHEIAVRLSLGASRVRILRQLVTESTVLAVVGGAIGLTIAWLALTWMSKTDSNGFDLAPDAGTFVFVFALSLVTGIVFGLSPALHATRGDVANALRDSGAASTKRSRLQRVFVGAQIVFSQPLLVFLGALLALVVADYRPLSREMSSRVIAVELRPLTGTGATGQRIEAVDPLIARVAERPEVLGAVPEANGFDVRSVVVPDGPARSAADTVPTILTLEAAAPGWFSLVDVPIILGRDVSFADTATADYRVVIGSDVARALWGSGSPVGRTLASPALRGLGQDSITITVVGVYDATHALPGMSWSGGGVRGSMSASQSRVYTARGKHWRHDRVLVRTRGPAEPFLPELRRFVREAAPSLPVSSMQTLAQADAKVYRDRLRSAMLAGAAGALALLLASLGLYGVVSLAVQQRTREIGIRIAVGAQPAAVARMFLASGVRVSVVALILGLPLSVIGLKVAVSRGIVIAPGIDVYMIGAVIAGILLTIASAATWMPARRAARVDPAMTLRLDA
jgi:predicted permease